VYTIIYPVSNKEALMVHVRCEVSAGLRDSERTVMVRGCDRRRHFLRVEHYVIMERDGVSYLPVELIDIDPKTQARLIELPLEADSGAHRVWVPPGSTLDADRVSA
jgi:hypothetical protein